jgi:hypothetical protein
MPHGFISTPAPRASGNVRDQMVYRALRDLTQRRGLRPIGLHFAVLMRRNGCDAVDVEAMVLASSPAIRSVLEVKP